MMPDVSSSTVASRFSTMRRKILAAAALATLRGTCFGHYPMAAYQLAFSLSAVLQLAALAWFALPWMVAFSKKLIHPPTVGREAASAPNIQPIEFPIFELHDEAER
jgi:hypothetical protein